MATAHGICGSASKNGTVVLMARIVDGAGVAIRRLDIARIEYSIFELDSLWPEQLTVVFGHNVVPLVLNEVVFDSFQMDDLWAVDDVGYNFRHEIRGDTDGVWPKKGFRYEIRYELLASGKTTVVRFRLRR
jgi:hypothetical protein